MRKPGPPRRLLVACALAIAACTPRQEPPRPPAPRPGPVAPPAPVSPAAPSRPPAAAPETQPAPAPAAAPAEEPADPERSAVLFKIWRDKHAAEVEAFEEFLVHEQVAQVVPTYQLLRSASMWKECHAEPFQLPPQQEWPKVRDLLVLLHELRERQVLPGFEVVSAYRDPRLNRCAGGAPGSAHVHFAVDIAPLQPEVGARLCQFWRERGQGWDMGVSRYPTGRIHIDRHGYRTWGASHRRDSSYCLR
jgi:hypothetical protein